MAKKKKDHVITGVLTLTQRQQQVLDLAERGYSSAEIAKELRIARRTVERHRYNIYRRVGFTPEDIKNLDARRMRRAADAILEAETAVR